MEQQQHKKINLNFQTIYCIVSGLVVYKLWMRWEE